MTLILTGQTRGFTFQVADRLVSVPARNPADGPYADHDVTANKNIVLLCADSLVTFGYTGLAYMADGRPTDRWIAEEIANTSIGSGMGGWAPPGPMHLNAVVERLRATLIQEFTTRLGRPQRRAPLEIVVAGQQRRRGNRGQPVLWHVRHDLRAPGSFDVTKANGSFRSDWGFRVDVIGSPDPEVIAALRTDLRARGGESPTAFRDILVAAVRATAASTPGVGADCMTITLQAGFGDTVANVDVEYLPLTPHVASVRSGLTSAEVPAAYSPYIIVPGWIWTPAVIEAPDNSLWHMGGITVRLRAPASLRGRTSVSGQRRTPPPR